MGDCHTGAYFSRAENIPQNINIIIIIIFVYSPYFPFLSGLDCDDLSIAVKTGTFVLWPHALADANLPWGAVMLTDKLTVLFVRCNRQVSLN